MMSNSTWSSVRFDNATVQAIVSLSWELFNPAISIIEFFPDKDDRSIGGSATNLQLIIRFAQIWPFDKSDREVNNNLETWEKCES